MLRTALASAGLRLLFYGLVTPLAVGLRLLGVDLQPRRFDAAARSYWRAPRKPADGA
jgi:hypothetical protein